jgi:hypothetical protein
MHSITVFITVRTCRILPLFLLIINVETVKKFNPDTYPCQTQCEIESVGLLFTAPIDDSE